MHYGETGVSGSPTDEEMLERASVDGRVAFAMTAAAATAGLIVLVDRVGAPERMIAGAGPAALLIGLALIGVLVRSMRITKFYAAGRTIPPAYAGLAFAAVAVALAAPFVPPVADHYSGVGVFAGFFGGLACATLISGPFLRKSGAFSISDLIARRFQHLPLRLGVAAVVGAAALLAALAGFETATAGLTTIGGLSRPASAAMVGLVLVLVTVPGGQAGVVWASAAAGGVFLAAFGLPLLLLLLRGQAIALPVFGDHEAWTSAAGRIAEWQGDAGQPASLTLSLGMALGMASCAPLLAPLASVRDRVAAVRAGLGGMIWSTVAATLIAATVAGSTTALLDTMVGRRPERLPDAIYAASATGLVGICGVAASTPAQARLACQNAPQFKGELRPQDVQTRGLFLTTALAPLASLGAAMSGLVWAAVVALGLALGAAGLLSASVALGNDAFHQVRDRSALTSRRLAITRGILIAAIVTGAAIVGARELDPRTLIGLALALSAIVLAPLMLLSLWPRARGVDAFVALIVGLCAAEAILAVGDISVHRLALGALAGFGAAVLTGLVSSLIGGGDRTRGYDFVAALFNRDGDALGPDKGA